MRKLFPLTVLSLLALASPLAAQSPAPQAPAAATPPAASAQPPAERRPLNLNLDEASRSQIIYGPGGPATTETRSTAGGLPSLGDGARSLDKLRAPETIFPKESNNPIPTPY